MMQEGHRISRFCFSAKSLIDWMANDLLRKHGKMSRAYQVLLSGELLKKRALVAPQSNGNGGSLAPQGQLSGLSFD